MPNRRLDWTINVESGGAVSSLNAVGRAGSDAARDIEQGFDQAGTKSEAAIKALTATMDGLESEAAAAAKAVAAIGEHVTIDMDESTITRFTTDLKNKFGLAFEDIEADAKGFAEVLERGVDMGKTTSEIRNVGDELDHTRESGDQSRSVLANLAGNSAQSLGELGGVVGDLGVGIGQLAEYAVDGNIKLSNLAAVAGPMAALAAAGMLVSEGMKGVSEIKAFDAERAKQFTEAIRDGVPAMSALRDIVADTGKLMTAQDGAFGSFGGTVADILPLLEKLGIDYTQFTRLVNDPAEFNALVALRDATEDPQLRSDLLHIINGVQDYATAAADATRQQQELNDFLTVTPAMLMDSVAAYHRQQAVVNQTGDEWQILTDWLTKGGAATDEQAAAMETLTESTGKTADEIVGLIELNIDQKMEANAASAKATAAAYHDLAAQAKETGEGLDAAARLISSADFDAAGIAAAGVAMSQWFDATAIGAGGGPAIFNDYVEAVQGLGSAMQETGPIAADVLAGFAVTDDQRTQLAALTALGQTIMPRITDAFEKSGGSFDQFDRNVTQLSQSIHNDLVTQLIAAGVSAGDAEDQANALQQALGLIPGNVSTFFKLEGDADATAKLALLQGSMDLLSEGAQAEVAMHILADDPQAALEVMQADITAHSPTAQMHLNTGPAMTDYWAMAGAVQGNTLTVPVQLSFADAIARLRRALSQATGGIFGGFQSSSQAASSASSSPMAPMMLGAPTALDAAPATAASAMAGAALVPVAVAGPARPINIKIQAGVIGGRYDVERAVTSALRDAARLGRI